MERALGRLSSLTYGWWSDCEGVELFKWGSGNTTGTYGIVVDFSRLESCCSMGSISGGLRHTGNWHC